MINKVSSFVRRSGGRNAVIRLHLVPLPKLSFTDKVALWIGTVGGIGFLRPASGTWGSIPGFVCFILMARLDPASAISIQLGLLVCAIWSSGRCERIFAAKDPKHVVIDEMACVPIALWPLAGHLQSLPWFWWPLLFAAYRLSDIIKPFPARNMENINGGLGVVLDDAVSASYLALLLLACRHLQIL